MTAAIVLPLLQVDLGELYPTEDRKKYLSQAVDAALAFIAREGITLEDTVEDLQLVEMYAAYLVRKRNTTEAMPRMLRWTLNNRLFSQKSGG
mgnify:FL=1